MIQTVFGSEKKRRKLWKRCEIHESNPGHLWLGAIKSGKDL